MAFAAAAAHCHVEGRRWRCPEPLQPRLGGDPGGSHHQRTTTYWVRGMAEAGVLIVRDASAQARSLKFMTGTPFSYDAPPPLPFARSTGSGRSRRSCEPSPAPA